MASTRNIKLAMLAAASVLCAVWLLSGVSYKTDATAAVIPAFPEPMAAATPAGYVGTETCKACHEDQFNNFAKTKHAKLGNIDSWKDKVHGCESCHGPGQAHVEGSGDVTKIGSFKNMTSMAASETCLACHAGKESHNNYRRGEHWRNNVACTDCHTAHGASFPKGRTDSVTFVGRATVERPSQADDLMLKEREPSLCISCHNETRAQFTKPFHHKVLEGTMNCSDCHNPHGGFEAKQQRLAVGADASCIRCHTNKQGPFVFEHAPLKVEGCTICHTPHGSANAKLLKRPQVRQLCFECHTGITDELSPGVPSRHNQALVKETQCTVCHSAIHGSNSSRLFFR